MSQNIHPTAVVHEKAKLGKEVQIGPYCVVGEHVHLHDKVVLKSHVVVEGYTEIGEGTIIFPFAAIGLPPQDLKFSGEPSRLIIGKNNNIREYVTMQPGTEKGGMLTTVGDNGLFMASTHIAHDCHIGNNVVMANNATLGGHVEVGDFAIIGGLAAVHQFTRIGHHAMIGGMAGINYDVIPYAIVMGRPSNLSGLNLVGMKRNGLTREQIDETMKAYNLLFDKEEGTMAERLYRVSHEYQSSKTVQDIIDFMKTDSQRALCLPA